MVSAASTGWRDTTVAEADEQGADEGQPGDALHPLAREPLTSTSSSRANDPNAAKVATSALPHDLGAEREQQRHDDRDPAGPPQRPQTGVVPAQPGQRAHAQQPSGVLRSARPG